MTRSLNPEPYAQQQGLLTDMDHAGGTERFKTSNKNEGSVFSAEDRLGASGQGAQGDRRDASKGLGGVSTFRDF